MVWPDGGGPFDPEFAADLEQLAAAYRAGGWDAGLAAGNEIGPKYQHLR